MAPLPILFLNIEQGPKAGYRHECKAPAISTVGRGRANMLQINRDSGISQQHLCFQWRDGSDDDDVHVGWTAIDAGSSNGTIINGVLVEPHKEIYIHTGDLIKIGSETIIRVEILGVGDEIMLVPKGKGCSKRKDTCIASESHDKRMSVVTLKHTRKARRAAGKAFATQECQSKQLNAMEGEVSHGKHHIHDVVEEGPGNQKDDMTNEVYNGKQHNNIAEGHGKQQDERADLVLFSDGAAEGQGKHDIDNEAEEGQGEQGCSTTAQAKHGNNNVGRGKQDDTTKMSRDHEHENKIVMASVDIDVSMTVEQWFQHLMEEGPKYLYQVSESIIQDVILESKQFDEYVRSLS